jgi:hypothetical protein
VLLRLAYLSVTSAFALLRLFLMSDWDKDVEIVALRHQITVLERQLGKTRPRFTPGDRAFLAALPGNRQRPAAARTALTDSPADCRHPAPQHRRDRLGGILHEYRHAALPARMRFSASTGLVTGNVNNPGWRQG